MLVSAMQQREAAINIHISAPSWASLPPQPQSHPSGSSQSWTELRVIQQLPTNCLFYTRHCIYVNATLSVRPTLSFPHCAHKSVLYVCVSITKARTLSKPRSQNYLAPFDLTSKQIAIKSIKLSLSLSYLDKYFKVKKPMAYQIFYMIF